MNKNLYAEKLKRINENVEALHPENIIDKEALKKRAEKERETLKKYCSFKSEDKK